MGVLLNAQRVCPMNLPQNESGLLWLYELDLGGWT